MTTYYLYAFLLDKDEQEMTEIPRVFIELSVEGSTAVSTRPIQFVAEKSPGRSVCAVGLAPSPNGKSNLSVSLNEVRSITRGDTLTIPTLQISAPSNVIIAAALEYGSDCSFSEFMDTHPKVTEKEILEAAFMAGHRMATTLLTGEPT